MSFVGWPDCSGASYFPLQPEVRDQLIQFYAGRPGVEHPGHNAGVLHVEDRPAYIRASPDAHSRNPYGLLPELSHLAMVEGPDAVIAVTPPDILETLIEESPKLGNAAVADQTRIATQLPGRVVEQLGLEEKWGLASWRLDDDFDEMVELARAGHLELNSDEHGWLPGRRELQLAQKLYRRTDGSDDPNVWTCALALELGLPLAAPGDPSRALKSWWGRRQLLRRAKRSAIVERAKSGLLTQVPERVAWSWIREGVRPGQVSALPFRPDYSWSLVEKLVRDTGSYANVRGEQNMRRAFACRSRSNDAQVLARRLRPEDLQDVHPGERFPPDVLRLLLQKHGPIPIGGSCAWIDEAFYRNGASMDPGEKYLAVEAFASLVERLPDLNLTRKQLRDVFETIDVCDLRCVMPATRQGILWNASPRFFDLLLDSADPTVCGRLVFGHRWPDSGKQATMADRALDASAVNAEQMGRLMEVAPKTAARVMKRHLGDSWGRWDLFYELFQNADPTADVGEMFAAIDAALS